MFGFYFFILYLRGSIIFKLGCCVGNVLGLDLFILLVFGVDFVELSVFMVFVGNKYL